MEGKTLFFVTVISYSFEEIIKSNKIFVFVEIATI